MLPVMIGFVAGFLCGASVVIGYVVHMGSKILKKKSKTLNKLDEKLKSQTDELKQLTSVADRLAKVKEITEQQLDLQSHVEHPQKNAMDGKYKNMLMKQIKTLEEEKISVLESIIKDGYDPVVSVLTPSGEVESIKLSEFLCQSKEVLETSDKTPKQKVPPPKRSSKFTVYTGGKAGNDEDPTTH